jgi:hypothetical protein
MARSIRKRVKSKKSIRINNKAQYGGSPAYRLHQQEGFLSQQTPAYDAPSPLTIKEGGHSDHIVHTSGGGRRSRRVRRRKHRGGMLVGYMARSKQRQKQRQRQRQRQRQKRNNSNSNSNSGVSITSNIPNIRSVKNNRFSRINNTKNRLSALSTKTQVFSNAYRRYLKNKTGKSGKRFTSL